MRRNDALSQRRLMLPGGQNGIVTVRFTSRRFMDYLRSV